MEIRRFLIWEVRFHCDGKYCYAIVGGDFEVSYSLFFYMVCSLFIHDRVHLIINNFYFHIIICINNTFVYKVTKKKKNMMSKIRVFMDP